jgi:ABC-2 type transport system ATP-binding protein
VAAGIDGVRVIEDAGTRPDREVLVVRALLPALDELVPRLVREGIALRELTPVVSPLESAFLALTEHQIENPTEEPVNQESERQVAGR